MAVSFNNQIFYIIWSSYLVSQSYYGTWLKLRSHSVNWCPMGNFCYFSIWPIFRQVRHSTFVFFHSILVFY